jgi:hypothetical protein
VLVLPEKLEKYQRITGFAQKRLDIVFSPELPEGGIAWHFSVVLQQLLVVLPPAVEEGGQCKF